MTMYLDHFGLREAPFRITPHTEFFFAGANRGATLEALTYAITAGEGMVKVTGEVGSGKTMLCRVLMERLPDTVETIYLAVPSLSRDEMLAEIAGDLGIDTAGANTTKLLRALQEKLIAVHAAGRQVVALIDEAHAMPAGTLEEIRLLSNLETDKEKLLQIVLFGQPELDTHLAAPGMRQLKERITHAFVLAPLPPREISEYIKFRLRAAGYHGPDLFGTEALRIIAEASEGLTRRINIYADKTLLAAFAAGTHTVTADHARAAVSDTQIVVAAPAGSQRRVGMVAALGIAFGVAVGFGLAQFVQAPSPAPAVAAVKPVQAPAPAPVSQPVAVPVAATTTIPAEPLPPPVNAAPPTPAKPMPSAAPLERKPSDASVSARLEAGRELLASAPGTRFSVQLMVTDANSREYLESWLADAGRAVEPGELYLVPAGGTDTPRVGVLFGSYADRGQASEALATLPASLRQFRPYVRSLDAVREDARRAPGR
ncbi:MAG TPA: AAA family ATPase [Usitatibacter sp.]|nr:AAA family ATPase [Usitatibacter sp.]